MPSLSTKERKTKLRVAIKEEIELTEATKEKNKRIARGIWNLWNIFRLVSQEVRCAVWIRFKGKKAWKIDATKESSNLGQSSWWWNWFKN